MTCSNGSARVRNILLVVTHLSVGIVVRQLFQRLLSDLAVETNAFQKRSKLALLESASLALIVILEDGAQHNIRSRLIQQRSCHVQQLASSTFSQALHIC